MDYDQYNDEQLVNGLLKNDGSLIEYFFYKRLAK